MSTFRGSQRRCSKPICNKQFSTDALEEVMEILLIVLVVFFLFGGGGYYGYRRWR
jgi:hypothetical protein